MKRHFIRHDYLDGTITEEWDDLLNGKSWPFDEEVETHIVKHNFNIYD